MNHHVTEPELALLGRWVARAFLEVERAQRSPWTLERLVTPLVLRVLCRVPVVSQAAPVTPSEVGGVAVCLRDSVAYLTVGVAAPGQTWDALLVELRLFEGRWAVVDLGRLSWRCEGHASRGTGEPRAVAS